jgi:hypothetical protein
MENKKQLVGYDSKTGLYTFKVESGYNQTMEVNGNAISDPLLGFRNGELFTTLTKPESIVYKSKNRVISGYRNVKNGEIMPLEQYRETVDKINKTKTYDESLEDFTYDSIKDEVFALTFYRTYAEGIYKDVETEISAEIEIIEYPVSEYKEITPLYSLDAKNVFDTKCKYVPQNIEMFYEVCEKYGIDKSRITIPTHSGLQYVKIDDTYLTGMEEYQKFSSGLFIGSYQECINKRQYHIQRLMNIVELHLAKSSKKVLDKNTVGSLIKELLTIKSSVYGLHVKTTSSPSQRGLLSKLDALIEIYKQLA